MTKQATGRVEATGGGRDLILEAFVEADGARTRLTFVHHLDAAANAAEVGPGWEYYLDALVAAEKGEPAPDFDDYFPAMSAHYGGE